MGCIRARDVFVDCGNMVFVAVNMPSRGKRPKLTRLTPLPESSQGAADRVHRHRIFNVDPSGSCSLRTTYIPAMPEMVQVPARQIVNGYMDSEVKMYDVTAWNDADVALGLAQGNLNLLG